MGLSWLKTRNFPSFVVLSLLIFHGIFCDRNPRLMGRKERVESRKTGENGASSLGREMEGIGVRKKYEKIR